MKTTGVTQSDLCGVFAVPPLARRNDSNRSIDFEQNDLIVRHIERGGITRLLYGGNAFLYHATLAEYEQLLEWLAGLGGDLWLIPSVGPSFGRAMDQSVLLRRHRFPAVMMLPCSDPRDAAGLERGYREVAEAAGTKLIAYIKEEGTLGSDMEAGLDALARLVSDGVCAAIKYAVVRADPKSDAYLESLLNRVDRRLVCSGIGERPAVIHMRDWKLPGFTTGSGCIAPRMSQTIFDACARGDFTPAAAIRNEFLPVEDLRDKWGPARVLHSAVDLAGVAKTGPIAPYVSALSDEQQRKLAPIARSLAELNG
jgi:dihydrodipicolinate synthase/N-acetylneuraminate lyase